MTTEPIATRRAEESVPSCADLCERIEKKQVIVFAGAGVSVAATQSATCASWPGLLRNGADRCAKVTHASADDIASIREAAQKRSAAWLVTAAQEIYKFLTGVSPGEFARWLNETVGALELKSRDLIEAIAALDAPIVTTNYDTLIEQCLGVTPIVWTDVPQSDRFIRRDTDGILHLHGLWSDPESVVFDWRSYYRRTTHPYADALLKAIRTSRTLLFVGFGAGFEDPTFEALLEWSRASFAESTVRHYRLICEQDLAREATLADPTIQPIVYGSSYDDLAPFLRSLSRNAGLPPHRRAPSGSDADAINRYINQLKAYCRRLSSRSLAGQDVRGRTRIYVPLFVQPVPREVVPSKCLVVKSPVRQPTDANDKTTPILDISAAVGAVAAKTRRRNLVIFGDPGAGKTTTLHELALAAWSDPGSIGLDRPYLPFVVRLRTLAQAMGTFEEMLLFAAKQDGIFFTDDPPTKGFFVEWPRQTGCEWMFLFDGFDEVLDRDTPRLMHWLVNFLDARDEVPASGVTVITSRPFEGTKPDLHDICAVSDVVQLLPLTNDRETEFAKLIFGDGAENFVRVFRSLKRGAARSTPLLLTTAAAIYAQHGSLPARRIDLYEAVVAAAFEDSYKRGMEEAIGNDDLGRRIVRLDRRLLERIALEATDGVSDKSDVQHTIAVLMQEWISGLSAIESELRAREYLVATKRHGGLVVGEGGALQWVHPSVREFLAACAIALLPPAQREDYLERWQMDAWSEVILFALVLLGRGSKADVAQARTFTARVLEESETGHSYVAAAIAEGYTTESELTERVIRRMGASARYAGDRDYCASVWAQLANRGLSPIELLWRLGEHPAAREELLAIVREPGMRPWMLTSTTRGLAELDMFDELHALTREALSQEAIAECISTLQAYKAEAGHDAPG